MLNLMRYMGGKCRQGKKIAEYVSGTVAQLQLTSPVSSYYEPFCGSLWSASTVIPLLRNLGVTRFYLSDSNKPLILMWKLMLSGKWSPPSFISEKMYKDVSAVRYDDDPLTAWCGHACSFGGKWFGGYARSSNATPRESQGCQIRSSYKKLESLCNANVHFQSVEYDDIKYRPGSFVYLDPPYGMGTRAKPYYTKTFDHDAFWPFAKKLSLFGPPRGVVVSEFVAPPGWRRVVDFGDTVVRHHHGSSDPESVTIESLFVYTKARG